MSGRRRARSVLTWALVGLMRSIVRAAPRLRVTVASVTVLRLPLTVTARGQAHPTDAGWSSVRPSARPLEISARIEIRRAASMPIGTPGAGGREEAAAPAARGSARAAAPSPAGTDR